MTMQWNALNSKVFFLLAVAVLVFAAVLVLPSTAAKRGAYVAIMQNDGTIQSESMVWIEDLESHPYQDCGHSVFLTLMRSLTRQPNCNPDGEPNDIDPAVKFRITRLDLARKTLERMGKQGLAPVYKDGNRWIQISVEFAAANWGRMLDQAPMFEQNLMAVLRELQVESGYADVPLRYIR